MSGLLAGRVWLSGLEPSLKPLAATLADIANDDGTSIYPSVAYIAWRLGRSQRSVQAGLSELRKMGALVIVGNPRGGRHLTVEYRMIEARLPSREPWRSRTRTKGANSAPFSSPQIKTPKNATNDTKGRNSTPETAKVASPDPSVPVIESSGKNSTSSNGFSHLSGPVAQLVAAAVPHLPRSKADELIARHGIEVCLAFLRDLYPQFDKGRIVNPAGLFVTRIQDGPEPSAIAVDWAQNVLSWWASQNESQIENSAVDQVLHELNVWAGRTN